MLMLAALTLGRAWLFANAGATKNVLAGIMNASAVLIFAFSARRALVGRRWRLPLARWPAARLGAWLMFRVQERALRIGIVVLGLVLTVALFARAFA